MRRAVNEDAWLNRPDLGLWAVADGAGGHEAGAVAARAAVEALATIPPGLTGAELLHQLRLRLGGVHRALGRAAADLGEAAIMASTIVALVARQGHFACVWAGDSRLYRWQNGHFAQITRDHSLIADRQERGLRDDGSVERNVITRALGSPADEPGLEKITGIVMPGDRFLLCSDGITKVFGDDELAAFLAADAESLVAAACARGAADNVTAIIVVSED
ncbi:MAG: serine/threonine-protein phosphatase [Proteobacteria bacterium]|nr:serine/threonine-protein phosphatase [Pseudomonadota bacterium]